jgi:hypothetical protein
MAAVVHRLDTAATRLVDAPGAPSDGYNDLLDEPYPYNQGAGFTDTRQEMAAIRIPCQLEVMTFEELNQIDTGDAAMSDIVLVFHRMDLELLGLLDATTRLQQLKAGDRVSALEKKGFPGTVVHPIPHDLYIYKIEPGSPGMGPDGYDLEICYLSTRPPLAQ